MLAGTQEPAIDLSDGVMGAHLPAGDRGHRLVHELHSLLGSPRRHVGLPEQGKRIELEVGVAEPPGDRERRGREPLSLGRVPGERRAVEDEPAVRGALLDTFESAFGAGDPGARDREVAGEGRVQERERARDVRRLRRLPLLAVGRERFLFQSDRQLVLALEIDDLTEAIQDLGGLAELRGVLEAGARLLLVGVGKRVPTTANEIGCRRPHAHILHNPRSFSGMAASKQRLRGGIDLGGTKVQAIVVGDRFGVKGDARLPTPTSGGPREVTEAMAEAMRGAAAAAGVESSALAGVGVGSPGAVDTDAGTVAEAGNLPNWQEPFPLRQRLEEALGTRVALGNDVALALEAEFRLGAGKPYSSMLGVFWGTGVGGGLVLDSKPWRGRGQAGEIGHMVVKQDGARCTCGRRGCVEAYAGRGAMERRARRLLERGRKTDLFRIMEDRGRTRLTSSVWAKALEKRDPMATDLIERAIGALGAGIASALNLVDVEAVVVGGGLGIRLGEPYRERIEKAVMPHLFATESPPPILLAQLGDLGGAIGAAGLIHP